MEHHDPQDSDYDPEYCPEGQATISYPSRILRVLAVLYVLSSMIQFVGFILLVGIGSLLWIVNGLSIWAIGFCLSGFGCLTLCILYRWWLRDWCRPPELQEDRVSEKSHPPKHDLSGKQYP